VADIGQYRVEHLRDAELVVNDQDGSAMLGLTVGDTFRRHRVCFRPYAAVAARIFSAVVKSDAR